MGATVRQSQNIFSTRHFLVVFTFHAQILRDRKRQIASQVKFMKNRTVTSTTKLTQMRTTEEFTAGEIRLTADSRQQSAISSRLDVKLNHANRTHTRSRGLMIRWLRRALLPLLPALV